MHRLVLAVLISCSLIPLFGGCGLSRFGSDESPSTSTTPTYVPVPTFTPKAVSDSASNIAPTTASTATQPSNTPTSEVDRTDTDGGAADSNAPATPPAEPETLLLPTATPTPVAAQLNVVADTVNVRSGPGTEYQAIDVSAQGEQFPLTGRNEQGDWWEVCCFEDRRGWLYGPLVEVQNAENVALVAEIPPTPVVAPTSVPVAQQDVQPESPAQEESAPEPEAPAYTADAGTSGDFSPDAQYQIVHYRVLGFDDNNGGIFNKGGQQLIFVTVLDQNGNGVDGAVVKNAVGDNLNVTVGSKGPGKAEIKMDWDPYKLYVAADPSGPVTSQVSNQMNNPYPHIPDVIGMLGPVDNEYAICPTVDDRCDPPFYHAHWSYEITFQKVK